MSIWDEEKYNLLRDEIFKYYVDSHWIPPKNPDDQLFGLKPMLHNRESFWNEIKKNPIFSRQWEVTYEKRLLSDEERYNLWFNLNYETGMERHFDPKKIPNYDDPYWEPTPKYLVHIKYKDKVHKFYRFS